MHSKHTVFLVFLLIIGLMVSCAHHRICPNWYYNPPRDPNYLFAAKTATSADMQLAVDKAVQDARVDLAAQLEAHVMGLIKKFDEEVGATNDRELLGLYSQTSKTVVDRTLVGARVRQQEVFKEGELYRACVLVELPLGPARELLLDQIKSNEILYTRFRASQAFKELEKEVEKLRKYKEEQEQKYREFEKESE